MSEDNQLSPSVVTNTPIYFCTKKISVPYNNQMVFTVTVIALIFHYSLGIELGMTSQISLVKIVFSYLSRLQ